MNPLRLDEQQQKMKTHPGFIAALDQSGGSTPGALRLYGIKEGAWSNILFENTMDRDIERRPTADYLWNVKRVVPFLKVDKGLAPEKDGSS